MPKYIKESVDLPDFAKESVPQIQILYTFQARNPEPQQAQRKAHARPKKETPAEAGVVNSLEARPGFEPGIKALQASALPLGHLAKDDV